MISISIDVTQLDKARFKNVTRKNGQKAVFCELVLIETPGGQYGDYMVKESSTKEEREKRVQLPIVGNGKNIGTQSAARDQNRRPAPPAQRSAPAANESSDDGEDKTDLPF